MLPYLSAVAAAYTVTLLITSASILERVRCWITTRCPWLTPYEGARPFIYCRMCVGFWVSLAAAAWFEVNFFVVYAASYFMATQERM